MRFAAALLLLAAGLAQAAEPVVYRVQLARAGDTRVAVSLEMPEPVPGPVSLVIPRAVPMGYSQQEYDRYVEDVAAWAADGTPLAVEREQGPRFRLGAPGSGVRRVAYRVDLARMEREILGASDSSCARPRYVGLLGYSVFGYLEGHEALAVRLEVDAPSDWPVLTTLAPAAPPPVGHASGTAEDFYALADSQLAMGPALSVERLDAPGSAPLFLAAYAEGPVDLRLTGEQLAQATKLLVAYFGTAPFAHYTALLELLRPLTPDHGYGFSMEHLSSSHYFLAADQGLTPQSPEAQRRRVLFNFVHHVSHAWIPKRAYGEGYYPFCWELAPLIDTIWLSEGFARYIAIEALADTMPLAEAATFRRSMLASLRDGLAEVPAFIREMPLVELSRVASTRYSEDFRTGRTLFSRGALLAAELDERIRAESSGSRRFRDLARHLVAWSAAQKRGFRVDELPGLTREATGVDTVEVWRRWLGP
jgi:predicted metalloprotease with PDZ domain